MMINYFLIQKGKPGNIEIFGDNKNRNVAGMLYIILTVLAILYMELASMNENKYYEFYLKIFSKSLLRAQAF